jgi:hypothetical protein
VPLDPKEVAGRVPDRAVANAVVLVDGLLDNLDVEWLREVAIDPVADATHHNEIARTSVGFHPRQSVTHAQRGARSGHLLALAIPPARLPK